MDKKNLKIFLVLASIGIFLFACLTSVVTITYFNRKMQCLYNGVLYNNGATFESSDKCNTCACNNGEVACTLRACINKQNAEGMHYPMKGLEVYCYQEKGSQVYSILPGTNRVKSYNEVTGESKMMLSTPVGFYTDKTKEEAKTILMNEYSFTSVKADSALNNCTPAEKLK